MRSDEERVAVLRRVASGLLAATLLAACSAAVVDGGSTKTDREAASEASSSAEESTPAAPSAEKPTTGGHVTFRLVDAPADVKSVFVTVARLDAEVGDTWRTLVTKESKVDLLTLRDGAFLELGAAELPPGHVGQLRLHLAEGSDATVVTHDDVEHPVSIPSAAKSGIKLVGGFDVPACASGVVTLDFDGERSVQPSQGPNGGFSLRPVVRIKAVVLAGDCDAGAAPVADPCASVTCEDAELCENGACRKAE